MDFRPLGTGEVLIAEELGSPDDLERFGSVYRENFGYVRSVVRRFGVPAPDCDDATQEVFVSAYRRMDSLSAHESVRAWLYSFARFTAFNFNRGEDRRRRKHGALALEGPSVIAIESADELVMRKVAEQFIERLDPDKREIFVLSELYDMTSREIATTMELNANTVRSRLRAARKQFRRLVAGIGLVVGGDGRVSRAMIDAARPDVQGRTKPGGFGPMLPDTPAEPSRETIERRWAAFLPLLGLSAMPLSPILPRPSGATNGSATPEVVPEPVSVADLPISLASAKVSVSASKSPVAAGAAAHLARPSVAATSPQISSVTVAAPWAGPASVGVSSWSKWFGAAALVGVFASAWMLGTTNTNTTGATQTRPAPATMTATATSIGVTAPTQTQAELDGAVTANAGRGLAAAAGVGLPRTPRSVAGDRTWSSIHDDAAPAEVRSSRVRRRASGRVRIGSRDRLREENQWIAKARTAVEAGDGRLALGLVGDYRQQFPRGQQRSAAAMIEARAQCLLGRRGRARTALRKVHPRVSERTRLQILGGCR